MNADSDQSLIVGFKDVARDNEQTLMSASEHLPDQSSFQVCSSGTLTAICGACIDHGVLAVGKVKHLWVSSGEGGYMRLFRGKGVKGVATDSEQAPMLALSQQPVSFAIEADQFLFPLYKNGVLTAPCRTKLDHGVPPLRHGTESRTDYWQMKPNRGAAPRASRVTSGCAKSGAANVASCVGFLVLQLWRQLLFLSARMPKIGTATLAVSRVRRYASLRV